MGRRRLLLTGKGRCNNVDKLIKLALEAGASNANILPVAEIPFDPTLRKLCEDNRCGKYNRNYG